MPASDLLQTPPRGKNAFPSSPQPNETTSEFGTTHTVPSTIIQTLEQDHPGKYQIRSTLDRLNDPSVSIQEPAGIFEGAHDFMIEKPIFQMIQSTNVVYKIDKPFNDPVFLEKFIQNIDNGGTVLLILDKKRVIGAEVDSSDREPPPRCHPETRKALRETLLSWVMNTKRHWNFVWLSGPAGTGKSAVAQTFAENCQEIGQLGAAFFFSRTKRDSPNGIIATIAYQLAVQDAGYNHLITRILSQNPAILDKTLSVQFQKLIIEPFNVLTANNVVSDAGRKPLVVIIDGLDECNDENAQSQLISLIGKYVQLSSHSTFPLLWLVCSRPEWHIKRAFSHTDPRIEFSREEISCNAAEDARDVYCILKDGLQEIYDKTAWDIDGCPQRTQWPPEAKLQKLSQKVGGLPVLASTVIRFIGDGSGTLDSQLNLCLLYLETVGKPSKVRPLDALDAFYRQIMIRVPQSILPTTKKIIAFYILSHLYDPLVDRMGGGYLESVSEVGRLLEIDRDTFYFALRNLHSVIDVPLAKLSHKKPITFFHKSFADFLQDQTRSKSFALDMDQARYDIAISSFRWHNRFLQSNCELDPCTNSSRDETLLDDPRWIHGPEGDDQLNLSRLEHFVRFNCWKMCLSLDSSRKSEITTELAVFNFCHLPFSGHLRENIEFSRFLKWITQIPNDLVRFKPTSESDEALATQFGYPLRLPDSLPRDLTEVSPTWLFSSSHKEDVYPPLPEDVLLAIWIGKGDRTALAFLMNY